MTRAFADACYYIAQLHPRDEWHEIAVSFAASPSQTEFVTTIPVLFEVLAFFAGAGSSSRLAAINGSMQFEQTPGRL